MNENDLDIKCVRKTAGVLAATSILCAAIMAGDPDSKTVLANTTVMSTLEPTRVPITVAERINKAPVAYGDNEASIDLLLDEPTIAPTLVPTVEPTIVPTVMPTVEPTLVPTFAPVATAEPVQQTNQQSKYDYTSKFFTDFSKVDRFIIYRIVEAEVTGKGYKCKKNVAAVIFNRIKSEKFPNTPYGVVFQKKQFAPTMDGRYWEVTITDETKEAVIDCYNEGYTANGAEYFANIADVKNLRTKKWFKSLDYLFGDSSGHTFYK